MPEETTKDASGRTGFKSGFVAIVGRPNAGKSTLVNRLVGQKIAIVTSKPQTTRNRIQGIVSKPEGQIIFIDTPGVHEADSALGRQMMHEVAAALEGIDLLLLMVDASKDYPHADALLLQKAERFRGKTILALNKVDRLEADAALGHLVARFNGVAISARTGQGMDTLLERIDQAFRPRVERMRLLIPYRDGPALALCYDRGRVIERADLPEGIRVEVEVPRRLATQLAPYRHEA